LDRRSTRWWLWPLVIGLGWFLAAQKMIDLANPQGHYKYLAFYQWMGTSFSSIATFPVRHPLIFLSHALAVNNWQLLFGFALGFGLAPLFRLRYTLPLVFLWIQLCLSGAQPRAILWLHYVIPYLPFLAWSTLVLVRDIRDGCFLRKFDPTWTKPLGMILCVIGPLYTQLLYGPAELPWHSVSGASVSPASILNHALTEIKPDDAVMTTFNLLNPLANREHLYSFNYLYLGRRQYSLIPYRVPEPLTMIVIDWQHLEDFQFLYRDSLFQGKTGPERLADLLQQRHLNLAEWNDGLAVYSRSGNDPYQPTEKITRPAPGPTFGNLSLVQAPSISHPVLPTSVPGWQRQVEAAVGWQVHQRVTKPLSLRFTLAQGSRIVWESTRVLGQGTEPATEWQPNESWLTRYRLAVPDTLHGSLQLTAHLLQLDGVYQENRWRGFSPVIQSTKDLGVVNFGRLQL
ncbi:MAG: DUF2079 domain-containing protein, partial [Candidatus Kerfeldbacteria bacterium]|nr:DUF2079 domain-containing protein [Candidatus Kerfeldbacteria bacterium]